MIYCIWYPSGGFGHYINMILSFYGENFKRPSKRNVRFSDTGDSHAFALSAPRYCNDSNHYQWYFEPGINHTVMIDNGINSQSQKFLEKFPDCKVIRLFYDDRSWPVVAQTQIVKASKGSLSDEVKPEPGKWTAHHADWAIREKFFLYLKDHYLRQYWPPIEDCVNINVGDLYEYDSLETNLSSISSGLNNFSDVHRQWQESNLKYFNPVMLARDVLEAVDRRNSMDLSSVTDLWTQAVINYFIWLKYQIVVPANTYADWFRDTLEINDVLSAQ